MSMYDIYSTVQAPPKRHIVTTLVIANIWGNAPVSACHPGMVAPLAEAGKVVANGTVGFGAPETVTVATAGFAVAVLLEELLIENLGEAPNMFPEVEFRKSI